MKTNACRKGGNAQQGSKTERQKVENEYQASIQCVGIKYTNKISLVK